MIYSSIDNYIRLVNLNLKGKQEILNFARSDTDDSGNRRTSLMSCKFSGDGKEIIGGSKSGEIVCYDLVSNRVSTRVP